MTHPSDVLLQALDDDVSVSGILLCEHGKCLYDGPRVDCQLSKACNIVPTEIVGIGVVNGLRGKLGVVIRRGDRLLGVRLRWIGHVAISLTLRIRRHRPST